MTRDEVILLTQRWVKRLELQNWDIAVRFYPRSSPELDDAIGRISWLAGRRAAFLKLCDPNDFPESENIEGTVVHELCHLCIQGHEEMPEEQPATLDFYVDRFAVLLTEGVDAKNNGSVHYEG